MYKWSLCPLLILLFMKLSFIILSLTFSPLVYGQTKIIYEQKAKRDDLIKVEGFDNRKGVITLTEDSISFKIIEARPTQLNFSLAYSEVKSINVFYGFLIPNRIKIRTWDGESFRLFTYRKKHLIRQTRARLNAVPISSSTHLLK